MGDDVTVLLYATSEDRAESVASALREERESLTVESVTTREDAFMRLGWPDVECLVVTAEKTVEKDPFVESIEASHPALPTVYYEIEPPSTLVEYPWVSTVLDGGVETVADRIDHLLEQRADERAQYTLDGSTPAKRYPNVDEDQVEELLEDGLERDQLREFLHKSQLFDELLASVPVHLYVKDENARHCYISKGYFEDELDEFLDFADPEMEMVEDDHAWRAFDDDKYVIEQGNSIIDKEEYLEALDQWNITSKVPWRDADGNVVGLIGVSREITDRKRREQEVREQNERLETFSDIVSHDLRNPLQVAHSALTLAGEECDSPHLETVAEAHERMEAIIDDVLSLAKYGQTVIEPEPVDLQTRALQAWETAGNAQGELVLDEDLGSILGDSARLSRLLENLFRNAVEHAGPEVTIRVEPFTRQQVDKPGAEPQGGFAIEDNGHGIPEDERDAVTDLGYSSVESGTGYGLWIVSEMVQAHGWSMTVTESEPGGARFEISGVERP